MAKKRKTKEQKKLADSRHDFMRVTVNPLASTYQFQSPKNLESKAKTVNVDSYLYLKKDLLKTTMLTLSILAFQFLLFAILKNHTIVIPGLKY